MKLRRRRQIQLIFSLAIVIISALATVAPALASGDRGAKALTDIQRLPRANRDGLKPALEASFGFRLDPGVECTGTFISSTGHFITALHCVAACLQKNGALSRELAIEEPTAHRRVGKAPSGEPRVRPIYTYKVTVDDLQLKDEVTCQGRIGSKRLDMVVVATGGKGWLTPKTSLAAFSKRFPDEYRALLDDGYEHGADFAVLKALVTKPPACLPLATESARVGQNLQAVSYPCLRREEIDVTGDRPLYTAGRRTQGFRDSAYFKARGEKRLSFDIASVERKETFFSSLDIEKCGSGTALLDERLNIVGIATRVYKSSTDYEDGSLEAIDVAHVLRELKSKRPADLKEMTSCPQRSTEEAKATSDPRRRLASPPG